LFYFVLTHECVVENQTKYARSAQIHFVID